MLDGLSLDQLRTFIAAAEAGSFSAAARQLRRAQSAVSDLIAKLEGQIGVPLFDRSGRTPKLTGQGAILLVDARCVIAGIDTMRARAKGMASGIEAELSVVIDVLFPIAPIVEAFSAFRETFPATPLRLYVESLGSTYEPLLDGRAALGLIGSLPIVPPSLTSERLTSVTFVMVAAREHPLAAFPGRIPRAELNNHTQLVLTDRSRLSDGKEFFVLSRSAWRLGDLFAKHAFLLAGLGWGGMPLHSVAVEIAAGKLVVLSIEDVPNDAMVLPMSTVYRTAAPPGPAGRWLIDRLKPQATGSLTK